MVLPHRITGLKQLKPEKDTNYTNFHACETGTVSQPDPHKDAVDAVWRDCYKSANPEPVRRTVMFKILPKPCLKLWRGQPFVGLIAALAG